MSPSMPIYNSQKNISANTAEPLRNEASKPFESDQIVVGAIKNATQAWSDAHDVMQYNEAKANYETGLAKIQADAALDPNYKNKDTYFKQLADNKNQSLKGISNKQILDKLNNEMDFGNSLTGVKIDTNFKQKEITVSKYNATQLYSTYATQKLNATTSAEALHINDSMQKLISDNVTAGIFTLEEANKLETTANKTSVQYQIYSDVATDEEKSTVLKELKDPKGKYSFLDADTRLDLIQESQKRIFQNNQSMKKETELSQNDRNIATIDKILNGTFTFRDLEAEEAIPEEQGGMKRKILLSFQNGLKSRVVKDLNAMLKEKDPLGDITKRAKQVKEFNELIDLYLSDETDAWKAKEDLIKAWSDGVLDEKEMSYLYPIRDNLKDIGWNKKSSSWVKNVLKSAVDGIKKQFGAENESNEDLAIQIKELLWRSSEGEDPTNVTKDIINKQRIKDVPDISTFPENGQLMRDPVTGAKAIVYPDGRIEAVK